MALIQTEWYGLSGKQSNDMLQAEVIKMESTTEEALKLLDVAAALQDHEKEFAKAFLV